MTEESQTPVYQSLTAGGIGVVVGLATGFAVLYCWVMFVFAPVGTIATGTPAWDHIVTYKSPWWSWILQALVLGAAWLSSVVVGAVTAEVVGDGVKELVGWNHAA